MATIANEIDRLFAADPDHAEGSDASRALLLACTSPAGFKQAPDGTLSPAAIVFDAIPVGMPGAVVAWVTDGPDLTFSGNQAQIAAGDMNEESIVVKATLTYEGDVYEREITINKVLDGVVGTSSFVWIKYADDATGTGLSDLPDGKKYIGFAQDRPTATESTNPADYRWSLIKGSDGSSLRMWIKYSDNADGTGLYDDPRETTLYIGIAVNKNDPVESTNKADYTWSKFKGSDGVSVPGSRGAGFYRTTGSAWNDATADAATPGGNVTGDIVTISDGIKSYTKEWDGSKWFVPGAFLSGSLFVEKSIGAAQINGNGLSIYTPDGRVIIDAGHTLAEQARANPNLVPAPLGWSLLYGGATTNRNGDGRYGEGSYFWLPAAGAGGTYIAVESPPCRIPRNVAYTVSFDAYCESGQRQLIADLYASGNVDSSGLTTNITTQLKRYWFTETMPDHADAPNARLRLFSVGAGANIVIGNVKVETGTNVTPWVDSVVSTANSGQRVMPDSITNVQFGGDLWSSNWNGSTGAGGQGWLLRRNGDFFANNITARGRIIGSLIESSAFKIDSGRLLTPWDRLCPFSISDMNMQMWSSGSGDCDVQLRDFVGPIESVVGSYNVKRFADMSKDVFLKAHVTSVGTGGAVVLEAMYNNDGWWRLITVVPLRGGALTVAIRYTTEGGNWERLHFRARTDGGVGTSLAFEMTMNNLNTALYLGGTNSGVAVNAPPPPPPPPPHEEPDPDDPWCVDYETARLPSGRYVRELLVDDLVEVWNDDPLAPLVELAPALSVRFGREQSYRLRTVTGAEIVQSKSTPMTLRDGRVAFTDRMLDEDVLVNRRGVLTWERVELVEDVGDRRVVKVSLGDRMYFAGSDPRATIATHNIQYKP